MCSNKITIAIDGYSSCGKSTLAKELAKELNYIFVDSGAMYRGVTLFALQNNLISNTDLDKEGIIEQLSNIELEFRMNAKSNTPELYLNNLNVSSEIRKPVVSSFVSKIAEIKEVRDKLVEEQRKMGLNGGIIMDGRDIGSVVFPNAELKLFVTAEIETRTKRRYDELIERGFETSFEDVQENLMKRDYIDSHREESPLTQTDDSIEIDNTNLTRSGQLIHALSIVTKKIEEKEDLISSN
ncbi:MAG: (d)CMP kinase [Flavobacteriales bacterium]|nr:(d)CMP kinase [Flavobacteriales bacterium]